jgi:signal transduction histidine kinase
VDRKMHDLFGEVSNAHVVLPPLVRDIEIDYAALSFVAPEKMQFKYKLEGRDHEWQNVADRRRAFYTDLPPGHYRFRVLASNNSGVWNEQGAALDFSVAAAYWQTNWFRAVCAVLIVGALWVIYQIRLRALAQRYREKLDERVGERTRIARELHDTLLQSFQGAVLLFQTVYEMLPAQPNQAKVRLANAIDLSATAIGEARDTVQGLRSSAVETNDLARAIQAVGEELVAEQAAGERAEFQVGVLGSARPLHPIVRDEIQRIANEALRNAFKHARATSIDVELSYGERVIRLRVRDDGRGIDDKLLDGGGPAGHYGLHGMRERAQLIGGSLMIWSGPKSGTEVEFTMAAAHAYEATAPRRSWLARYLRRRGNEDESNKADS